MTERCFWQLDGYDQNGSGVTVYCWLPKRHRGPHEGGLSATSIWDSDEDRWVGDTHWTAKRRDR